MRVDGLIEEFDNFCECSREIFVGKHVLGFGACCRSCKTCQIYSNIRYLDGLYCA